jgi:hypothetical protein
MEGHFDIDQMAHRCGGFVPKGLLVFQRKGVERPPGLSELIVQILRIIQQSFLEGGGL